MDLYEGIAAQALAELDYAVSMRRYFHSLPELSRSELGTQARIMEELERMGVGCEKIAGTGVIAEIQGARPGKTIVLRADIDALPISEENDTPYKSRRPGVMHACGHDMHAASLLCAVKLLTERRELISGKVIAVFQPGEEDGYGGVLCAADERVRAADRVFGLHVAPDLRTGTVAAVDGPLMASVDMFKIEIEGKESHISRPHLGADAALAAAETLISLKSIPAGMTDPWDGVLVGVGSIHAGKSYNILAGSAYLEGTVRAFSEKSRAGANERLAKIVRLTAEKYGCTAKISYDGPSPAVVNDPEAAAQVRRVAAALFGRERVTAEKERSYGGDDFSFFQLAAPGAYALVGSGDASRPETCVPVHNGRFSPDENALCTASALYAAVAIDFLL